MHEMSLMQSVLDTVRADACERGMSRVIKVSLVIGEMSMALPDSLRFAFDVLTEDELFRGSALEIEQRPLILHCRKCEAQSKASNHYLFTCASCGSGEVDIIGGRELYIDSYEGE
ncbi:MAG: hydrogenase maturation nickel metallochaperone HypA [Solirubrobacterales bacterium]